MVIAAPPPMLADEYAVLLRHLQTVPEFRHQRGMRHPLAGVLGLTVLGLMAGCRSLSAISRYATMRPEVLAPLGLRRPPSVPTLSRILGGIAPAELRAALLRFTRELAQGRQAELGAVAIDGKTLRGVHEDDVPAQVLHSFAHEAALVLDQVALTSTRDEVAAAETWISTIAEQFPGLAVLTFDALYGDRDLCAAIVAQDYASLIRLKKTNPPSWPTPNSSSPRTSAPPKRPR
jgi:hypothetical protein